VETIVNARVGNVSRADNLVVGTSNDKRAVAKTNNDKVGSLARVSNKADHAKVLKVNARAVDLVKVATTAIVINALKRTAVETSSATISRKVHAAVARATTQAIARSK
jgi:hypothetical protein